MVMSRTRSAAVALVLMGLPLAGAFAQQRLTNICVVEVKRIQEAFFRDSKRAKEYQAFRDGVKQELKNREEDLEELERKRLEASRANNTAEANRIADEISRQKADRDSFAKLKDQERLRMLADLMANDKFYGELLAAIEWVCRQEGYAAAFHLEEASLLWWDSEIDITDKVIERMNAQ